MLASALSSYLLKYHKYTVMWHQKLTQNYSARQLKFFRENSKESQFKSWNMLSCIHSWLYSKFFSCKKGQILDFTYMLEYLLELTSGLSGISTRFFSIKGP